MATARRAIVLTVPVWGGRHVSRFLDRVLPSWLAPGNLPALARERDVTALLLTGGSDIETIRSHPGFARLEAICPVRVEPIDDLIAADIATVTLTLAFHRGAALGRRIAPEAALTFLNADFLLADGSLAHLGARLDAGDRVVFASSLRALEDRLDPQLDALHTADGILQVPSRDLVRMALGALHPTVIACRRDQQLISSGHANQFFWRDGETTLLCRSLLLFPLAVIPTREVEPAATFCDFGFIEELCPEADPVVLADSDGWFALELCPERHEGWLLRTGVASPADLARSLSSWTTAHHRAQARHEIVIHADDVGPGLAAVRADAGRELEAILTALSPPLPAAHHPYWVSGVDAWQQLRRRAGLADRPPELAPLPPAGAQPALWGLRVRQATARLLVGQPGRRRPWQPGWALERLLRRTARGHGAARAMAWLGDVEVLHDLMPVGIGSRQPAAGDPRSAAPVIGYEAATGGGSDQLAKTIGRALESAGEATLVVRASPAARLDRVTLSPGDIARLIAAVETRSTIVRAWGLDDRLDRRVQAWHRALAADFRGAAWTRRFALVARSALGVPGLLLANLARAFRGNEPDGRAGILVLTLVHRRRDGEATTPSDG